MLEMIYLEGMGRSEVCMRLGIKRDCFSVVLHRAKSRLRKQLALPVDHTSKPECPEVFTVYSIETSKVF